MDKVFQCPNCSHSNDLPRLLKEHMLTCQFPPNDLPLRLFQTQTTTRYYNY
jgi:hypothetical protein